MIASPTTLPRTPLLVALFSLLAAGALAAEFHVGPNGSDANPGSRDKPFATLERARDAARALKNSGQAAQGVTVWITGGIHPRAESFTLTAEDSGTANAPMIFRAADETTRLVAGRVVPAVRFLPVTDTAVSTRLAPAARGRVYQLDLKALNVQHSGPFPNLFTGGGGIVQLFVNSQRLPLARWPNDGYTTMREVLDSGMKPQPHNGIFVYRGDRPARWRPAAQQGRLWIAGFWRVPWVIQTARVDSIDADRQTITLGAPIQGGIGSKYSNEVNGTRRGDGKEPWYAVNLLEELDTPGEWCIEFASATLYLWPPSDLSSATVLLADLATPIVSLKGASHIRLQGLTLEGGLGDAVRVEGGEGNQIAGCTIRNTGGSGINLVGGSRNSVQSCDLYDLGAGGVLVNGGDRRTLSPGGHLILNNHIHHFGQVQKIVHGIQLDGVGHRAAHNLIHDATYGGVIYHGNDHLLELNEIHNIGLDGGDLGAFYSNADWAGRGTVIRHNFIHHAPNANGAYMDDGHSGDQIIGNVMYRLRSGPFIGGGHQNLVRNNLVIECDSAVHLDDRGVSRGYNTNNPYVVRFLNTVNYTQPPWSARYPDLPQLLQEPTLPTGNLVKDNVFIDCRRGLDYRMASTNRHCIQATNNFESGAIPDLLEVEQLKFHLSADSPLAQRFPAFEPIPFEQIGLRLDDFRKRLPTAEATGRNTKRPPRRLFDSNVDMEQSNQKP